MNNKYQLQLGLGYYDKGLFIRSISEIRDGGVYPTGFHVVDRGYSSITETTIKSAMAEAEVIGIEAAAAKFSSFIKQTHYA